MEFKKYNHLEEEKKISNFWIKEGCFKPRKSKWNSLIKVVGNVGNAPTTSAMSMQHSTFELIPQISLFLIHPRHS